MPRKHVTQVEARDYKARAEKAESELRAVKLRANLAEHGGVHLTDVKPTTSADAWIVETAKRCKKIVVVRPIPGSNDIRLFAVDP